MKLNLMLILSLVLIGLIIGQPVFADLWGSTANTTPFLFSFSESQIQPAELNSFSSSFFTSSEPSNPWNTTIPVQVTQEEPQITQPSGITSPFLTPFWVVPSSPSNTPTQVIPSETQAPQPSNLISSFLTPSWNVPSVSPSTPTSLPTQIAPINIEPSSTIAPTFPNNDDLETHKVFLTAQSKIYLLYLEFATLDPSNNMAALQSSATRLKLEAESQYKIISQLRVSPNWTNMQRNYLLSLNELILAADYASRGASAFIKGDYSQATSFFNSANPHIESASIYKELYNSEIETSICCNASAIAVPSGIPGFVQPTPTVTPTITQPQTNTNSGTLTVHYLDAGQGDSELIQSPSGRVMLIDAGDQDHGSNVVYLVKSLGINTIDFVVATHPHEDHIGGMTAVFNAFTVKQFIDCGYPATTSTYENMLNLIDQKNIPYRTVQTGDTLTFDPAMQVQVLNPTTLVSDDLNQDSIVLKMTYNKVSYLFTGDAGEPVENQYASTAGHIDILKVAHHGSSVSSSSYFLSRVTPKVSIIEAGVGNPYGHPAPSTLIRLEQIGSNIYRTDNDGTIKVRSDGLTYQISKEKQSSQPITPFQPTPEETQIITPTSTNNPFLSPSWVSPTIPPLAIPTPSPTITNQITPSPSDTNGGSCPPGKCWVNPYYRQDGTHVNGYCRACS